MHFGGTVNEQHHHFESVNPNVNTGQSDPNANTVQTDFPMPKRNQSVSFLSF
jgi:hypothetical protein